MSALIADGPPGRVIEEAIDGNVELVVPRLVVAELDDVLTRKLGFEKTKVAEFCELLARRAAAIAVARAGVEAVTGDAKDDVVLACAVEKKADVLVTGDRKHLLPLGEYRGVRLLTPQALLAELRAPA